MSNEYINPIDKIICYLVKEKERRVAALESHQFCDNLEIERNIMILEEGINKMSMMRLSDEVLKLKCYDDVKDHICLGKPPF